MTDDLDDLPFRRFDAFDSGDRIATVDLTHTGLSRESAKFQARSAFTGVGFTTTESEKVFNHPIRRRLLLLMLLDNAGVVIAASSLIISFVDLNSGGSLAWRIVLLMAGIVVLWSLASSQWVDCHLSSLVSKALKRYTNLGIQDFAKLLHLSGNYQVTELQIEIDDWMAGKKLGQLDLPNEGVMVLGITPSGGRVPWRIWTGASADSWGSSLTSGRSPSRRKSSRKKKRRTMEMGTPSHPHRSKGTVSAPSGSDGHRRCAAYREPACPPRRPYPEDLCVAISRSPEVLRGCGVVRPDDVFCATR